MKKWIFALTGLLLLAGGVWWLSTNSNQPKSIDFYGQACLGPDKTNPQMILNFIVQGPDIYLDRNKDDVAQAEEKLNSTELPPIEDPKSGVRYQVKELRLTKRVEMVSATLPQCLAMTVLVTGQVNYEQIGQIFMSPEPTARPWIHFDGANRMIFGDREVELSPGNKIQLKVFFGTNAVGEGRDLGTEKILAADKTVDLSTLTEIDRFATVVPRGTTVAPKLSIEIPTTGQPARETIPLNEFC